MNNADMRNECAPELPAVTLGDDGVVVEAEGTGADVAETLGALFPDFGTADES